MRKPVIKRGGSNQHRNFSSINESRGDEQFPLTQNNPARLFLRQPNFRQ